MFETENWLLIYILANFQMVPIHYTLSKKRNYKTETVNFCRGFHGDLNETLFVGDVSEKGLLK